MIQSSFSGSHQGVEDLSSHMASLSLTPTPSGSSSAPVTMAVGQVFAQASPKDFYQFFSATTSFSKDLYNLVAEYVITITLDPKDPKFIVQDVEKQFQEFINRSYAACSVNTYAKGSYCREITLSPDVRDCLIFKGSSIKHLELNFSKNGAFGKREFFLTSQTATKIFQLTPNLERLSATLATGAFDDLALCPELRALRVKRVNCVLAGGCALSAMTSQLPGDFMKVSSTGAVLSIIQAMPKLTRLDLEFPALAQEDAVTIGSKRGLTTVTCAGFDPGRDGLTAISQNQDLRKLTLARSELAVSSLKGLKLSSRPLELSLDCSPINDRIFVGGLMGCKGLSQITIVNCKNVSKDGCELLARCLTATEIVFQTSSKGKALVLNSKL